MKKTMSRILALIIALSMLLVPSAFAAERNAASLTIGNFQLVMGEETISLPVYLEFAGGADLEGSRGFLKAGLSTESATAFTGMAALENSEIKIYLDGMNYGMTIPVEQLVSMLEEEMGMTLEEALTQAMSDPEVQAAMTSLLEMTAKLETAEPAEIDEDALLEALNVTLTEQGETAVTLFDVETTGAKTELVMAPTTLTDIMDAMSELSPELDQFYAEYFKMLNEMLAAEGEEITIEEALGMISFSMTGSICEAAEGVSGEIVMTVAITEGDESVSMDIPVTVTTLTDETGTYCDVFTDIVIDGEGLYLDFYVQEFTEGTDTYNTMTYNLSVYDAEDGESDMDMELKLYANDTELGYIVGAEVLALEGEELVAFGVTHTCSETVLTEEADAYSGALYGYVQVNDMLYELVMDTSLRLFSVPEGELLTFENSINPIDADDETLELFAADAQPALISGLGVLMQDPTLATLISGLMNGMMG